MLRVFWKHWHRAKEIGQIIARAGFGPLLSIRFDERIFVEKLREDEGQFCQMLQDLGPVFLNLGKILQERMDILPVYLARKLAFLENQGKPVPFTAIRPLVNSELGRDSSSVFSSVQEKPLSAGPINLLYRGVLKNGQAVVLKIQRPGIERLIEEDLDLLASAIRLLELQAPWLNGQEGQAIFHRLREDLRRDLYYLEEGRNGDRLRRNLVSLPFVRIPAVLWDYCSHRLLTLEAIEGKPLEEIHFEKGPDRDLVGQNLLRLFLHQILQDGFFHANPRGRHLALDREGKIVLYAFTRVGRLSPDSRANLIQVLSGILENDPAKVMELLAGQSPAGEERDVFQKKIADLLADASIPQEKLQSLGRVLQKIGDLGNERGISTAEWMLAGQTLEALSEALTGFAPRIDSLEAVRTIFHGFQKKREMTFH